MSRTLRPTTAMQVAKLYYAQHDVSEAAVQLRIAGCPRLAHAARALQKRVEGAIRHAERALSAQAGHVHEPALVEARLGANATTDTPLTHYFIPNGNPNSDWCSFQVGDRWCRRKRAEHRPVPA